MVHEASLFLLPANRLVIEASGWRTDGTPHMGKRSHIALCNSLFWQEAAHGHRGDRSPGAPPGCTEASRYSHGSSWRPCVALWVFGSSGRTIALQRAYDPSTEIAPARKSLRHATDCDIATDRIDQDRSVPHYCCGHGWPRLTARLAVPPNR